MIQQVSRWFNKDFPRNYILQHPPYGALMVGVFIVLFALLYRPLGAHAGRFFGYGLTMASYSILFAISVNATGSILKKISFFALADDWTILKEISAIIVTLIVAGLVNYLAAFVLETPADRWNFATLFDSVKRTFLVGVIPFVFFTSYNIRRLVAGNQLLLAADYKEKAPTGDTAETYIRIESQLKKEELGFYPSQFIYAESESNYVIFYFLQDNIVQKEIIRNTISNVEEQLSHIPWFVRTHRAFIVNLKKVEQAKGNSLGFRIKLTGIDGEIPVSRSNTKDFITRFEELKKSNP
jgi:DNA-binding LytR/AlgR family response regulator